MNFFTFSAIINLASSLIIGLFVLAKNIRNPVNRNFFYFCFGVAFWSAGYILWQISSNATDAYFWTRVLMVGAASTSIFYLSFVIHFLDLYKRKFYKVAYCMCYVISLLFILINVFTSALVDHVESRLIFLYWPIGGIAFVPFLLMFFGYIVSAIILLIIKYKENSSIKKSQILYILLGIGLAFLGGSTNYFLWFNIPILPFGTILVSAYPIFIGYAITRYRFLDIRFVIRKTVITFIIFVMSISIVVAILLFIEQWLTQATGISGDIVVLISMAALLLIFNQLRHGVQQFVDRFIFTDYIDLSVRVHDFQRAMPHINNVESLGESVAKMLRETYHVQDVWFLVYDHISKDRIVSRWPYREEIILPFTDPLLQLSHEDMHILVKDELMAKDPKTDLERKAIKQLDYLKTKVAVPFGQPKWCFGMLLLGPKITDQPFTVEEIKSLNSLANSLKMEVPQVANVQMMIDDARRQRGLEV